MLREFLGNSEWAIIGIMPMLLFAVIFVGAIIKAWRLPSQQAHETLPHLALLEDDGITGVRDERNKK